MTKDETLRLALYTMEYTFACSKNQLTTKTKREYDQDLLMKAITAIKEALETKDDLVALQYPQKDIDWQREQQIKAQGSATPQRTWVGLKDEEIETIYAECNVWDKFEYERMLEAKLKEKNI